MSIYLCEYNRKFLEKSYFWLNDPIIQKNMNINKEITREDQELWYNTLSNRKDYKIWGISFDDKPIGACGFRNISDKTGEITIYIGEKDYWGGTGSIALELLEKKAIDLDLQILFAKVLKDNNRSYKLFLKKGFNYWDDNGDFYVLKKEI